MGDEQRREKRIATRQRLWCEGQDQDAPSGAETRDVSRNGMFIVAENAPEIGSQMKVTLEDDGAEVTLQMEVVWRGSKTADNKTGVGMRIVGFDKGRETYERFINRHLKPSTMPSQMPKASVRPMGNVAARATEPPKTTVRPDAAGRTNPPKP
ncbi:MAG TPA: PilZ domain-containing protein [Polyangiales bacterium]|nr:PilZ domain-containing protein [Polyangiales bacterium]